MESDDPPRAKFLCSFGGSVLPRPLDGRLRYVSGETRIVSLPRDITFADFLSRARELFDGTSVIKYQSPDDELDALVSVINDDDVVNMMEEYDKLLASSNGNSGITRLRIFLFSNYEYHFDVDEGEISERRYVDALNNVADADHGEFANSPYAHFENMGWVGENGGFPSNLGHVRNLFDGSPCVCEYCRVGFHRSQAPTYLGHFSTSCAECYRNREPSLYNESHGYDHGSGHHHQHHRHQGSHHYVVDGNVMNAPFGHGNFFDEFGNEVFHRHHPSYYGVESPHQVLPNLPPIQYMRRRVQVPIQAGMPHDSQGLMLPNGYGQIQSPWIGQNSNLPQNCYGVNEHSANLNPNVRNGNERISVVPNVNLEVIVEKVTDENLGTNLPELIDSVKDAALERAEEVKAMAEENPEDVKETPFIGNGQQVELEAESDGHGDHKEISKIEPTKAEAEAFAQGLQTIRNEDLEEIRELGSGAYGSVYHGKWRGSDVAIKRIKASCFTGKPSERARLLLVCRFKFLVPYTGHVHFYLLQIADFWKEALMLSSLHHPNVVSFYGVVRDGPDGNLATVTEFMINGSLKQFLQKKDRTIDRRKRLIIAMDAAFGMEYLHGKNIVHFDLKCENLLVNMRDPQRPICKIGDLGLSKVKQRTLVSGGVRGTLPWMAPELLTGKTNMVTEKVDVYSFGIVMWELLTGEEPYGDMHCGSVIGGIMSNSLRPQIPTWCDPEWKSLMESCWSSDPLERPLFSEISQKLRKMAAAIILK